MSCSEVNIDKNVVVSFSHGSTHTVVHPPCLRVVTFVNFLFLVVVVVSLLFLHPHPTAAVRGFLSDPKKSDDERLSL